MFELKHKKYTSLNLNYSIKKNILNIGIKLQANCHGGRPCGVRSVLFVSSRNSNS